MNTSTLLAFGMFAFVASITPGPNNLMVLASGVNFGFRRTIPHMLGITVGFLVLLLLVGFGVAELFARLPVLYEITRWIGALYLLVLAVRIARSGPVSSDGSDRSRAPPLGFVGAALFQWVNPKAWVTGITAFATYLPPQLPASWIVTIALFSAVVNLPCIACWTLFGTILRRWLGEPRRARIFNVAMAVLLVLSLLPLLL